LVKFKKEVNNRERFVVVFFVVWLVLVEVMEVLVELYVDLVLLLLVVVLVVDVGRGVLVRWEERDGDVKEANCCLEGDVLRCRNRE